MDLSGSFFSKLRALVITLEQQNEQLKQAFRGDETEFEDDSPMRYLHELYSEIRTLKVEAGNVLTKKSQQRDTTYDFIKASKVLMNRNAVDLGKTRELFEKYGYKPIIREAVAKDEAETDPEPAKSDQEEPKNHACPENSSKSDLLVRIPQLSDFGLSKYALPSTWNNVNILPQANVQKEQPREDYCPSPKTEQFCIKGRDLCVDDDTVYLSEDQTIFLLNNAKKSRQANKMQASKENLATPREKSKVCDYDYMASPVVPTFCTPGLKVPSRKNTTLPKSPESNQSDVSNHMNEATKLDPQSLRKEPEQACVIQMVPNKRYMEEAVLPSEKYLDCLKIPAPPVISDYRNILNTPPPAPEITVIPTQILQILSKYNSNIEPPRVTEKMKNEEMAAQFERRPVLAVDISHKENREYCG
ncbi:spindle and kinetochore-associated protein 3 [Heteronotia binoei]|uniref:spindle and kinetochore-associated protein 3 n=1 Tax=Heteronotia binoei TaxID=13085 RepID=UPI00292DD0E2|nr:spindle and kinetochore-associated protein 3 [Heteronotia binoei]XP_060090783.1 spindle and kinetochore-associated protein 3 [Heteronotia binoei]